MDERRLAELRAEASHARRRVELYRAKLYSDRPASPERLRELEVEAARAQQRLEHAESTSEHS